MTATAETQSQSPHLAGASRWPLLLRQLRHAARPDRARVAAYVRFAQGPGGWGEYRAFLANHQSWLAGLNRALAEALPAVEVLGQLPELENEGARVPALPLPTPQSRAQALGYLYVLEAFRLGSEVLRRYLETPGEARREGRGRPWAELVHALRGVPPEDQPTVVASARDLFLAWERWLSSPLARAAEPGAALVGG